MATVGCRKPIFVVEEGPLTFSDDTVFFDTIFTGFPSPSGRLIVINNTDHHMQIGSVGFENGAASDFSMIFDGLDTNVVEDYVLASGDSAVVFIKFTSDKKDDYARDRLVFQIGNDVQKVDIEAYIKDAVFYKDSLLANQTTIFDPDKAHVIDGVLLVPDGSVLVIPAGTKVYFTPRLDSDFNLISSIRVMGTLRVTGQAGNPAVFKQTRFGERYEETPGQWRGISFGQTSASNILEYAVVKNANVGLQVEFAQVNGLEKVKLNGCEIRNMAGYGIAGVGYSTPGQRVMIDARNSLIHNCKEATFLSYAGGQYRFINCTFANYTMDFSRNSPQILLNNYDPDALLAFDLDIDFLNCIIWGSEEEEIGIDSALVADSYHLNFENCLIRTKTLLPGIAIDSSQNFSFPQFLAPTEADPTERDYRIGAGSPARDRGQDPVFNVSLDLDGLPRLLPYDMGAYEYRN